MGQREAPRSRAPRWSIILLLAAVIILVLLLIGRCSLQLGPAAPTPTPGIATPAPGAQQIVITEPAMNATVTSPIQVSGTVSSPPAEGRLEFRLIGPDGGVLASGVFMVEGEGGPIAFSGTILYTLAEQGSGRIEVLELNQADGSIRAIAAQPVTLGPSQAEPVMPTPAGQQITIDTPPPDTLVGSPVVITGRTARRPAGDTLNYFLRDAGGAVLGSGTFPVSTAADGSGTFNASLTFNLPPNGGAISLEIFEPGAAGGPVAASATLQLQVAPPQTILIDTPPPGTVVGSPVVITGRTARFPFQGSLAYRVLDAGNRELGSGTFPVQGAQGAPSSFTASLTFNLPPGGGRITVEIVDQNAADGQIAAAARIDLSVAAQEQAIIIETPPANTLVGSPMTITGRTVRLPAGSALTYRVRNASGQQIGQGQFGVTGTQDGGASFNAQIFFSPPQAGGPISLELLEIDPANNQVRASATLQLQVAGPPPAPTATSLPTVQSITIETPPAGTVVGSPVVITGRAALPPRTGSLNYVVRSLNRETLGQGSFPVAAPPGQPANIPFVASINFAEPPQGGAITVEIYDRDAVGNILASAIVRLQVNPRGQPTPTIPSGGQIVRQEIIIETPPPGTVVGSPVVITGRTTLPPLGGALDYRVLDEAGNLIGEGSFSVPIPADAPQIPFVASLTFDEPPQGGAITVVIADIDDGSGEARAEAEVELSVAPPPYPQPRTP